MQRDDGSRNAVDQFMEDVDGNFTSFSRLLVEQGQYWKCRVLLELIWDYQTHRNTKIETGSKPEGK